MLRLLRPCHRAHWLPALLAIAAVAWLPLAWPAGTPGVEPRIAGAVGEPLSAVGFTPAGGATGLHAPTTAYNHGDPTPQEQLMLELVNRARANPPAEAARFGMDLNENLPPDTISPHPKPPLAFHPHLITAARAHSDWMLAADVFSHDGENGSTPGDRMVAAGYVFSGSWTWGENIAWKGTTGTPNPTQFSVDMHEGLFRSPGHRENLMHAPFDEIGIGIRSGVFTLEDVDYNAVMATQNFARSGSTPAPLVLGVVFRDANGDQAYSVGEGLAGVTVTPAAGGAYAVTSGTGGFAFPAPATSGTITVTITGPGLAAPLTKTVNLAAVNVKLDFEVNGETPLTFVPGSAGFDAEKRFRFDLAGPNGAKARVEHSADLVTWQPLGTYTLNGGKASVTDNSGSQSRRLYRAVLVP
jgi:hypothetical protein